MQLGFVTYEKNGLSQKMTSQWCHRWARPICKCAVLS